jgi:hypothetical protein
LTASRPIRLTRNFERNLAEIQVFLEGADATAGFGALLDALVGDLIPNLERFPKLGSSFLARRPGSAEGLGRWDLLNSRAGDRAIREYLLGDFLVLYLESKSGIDLLAIRHHRQLSYDLEGHWPRFA